MIKNFHPPASLSGLLNRLRPSEPLILGGVAVLVGLLGGIGVWLFKQLILLFHYFAFDRIGASFQTIGPWLIALVPVLGGLLVGAIKYYWIGEERHHGVAGIIEAAALAGGRLRYRRMPAKTLAASVSIGFGASVGPEDPSVQIGANLGSLFGQVLHLSDERVRALVAAGAAAGISAAFNAPITGVFFALEIILGVISGASLGIILIASIVSAVFIQAVSGPDPAFAVPAYAIKSYWELPLFILLGLLAGPSSALYIRMLYWVQDLFHSWRAPEWVKPAAAGLVVGLVGIFLPQIFGVGYDTIE